MLENHAIFESRVNTKIPKGRERIHQRSSAIVLAVIMILLTSATRAELIPPATCGTAPMATAPKLPLPAIVTGRVAFYATAYQNGVTVPSSELSIGDPTEVFPTASMFKTLVVHAALQAVDASKLKLNQPFITTAENRSIEAYPLGTNSLEALAERAIRQSDNTASDILHQAVGTTALARQVKSKSPCTTVLLTTKALWAAQAGLAADVLGSDVVAGARAYAELPFEDRLPVAARLNAAAHTVAGPAIETALDTYFHGPTYTPELELWLQNTTTAKAFTDLLATVLSTRDLKPTTRSLFRTIMSKGCCVPKNTSLRSRYRAAKAGSGWRILTLSGYAELPNGLTLAYTFLNDQSDTLDSEDMEKQIRPVNAWIDQVLLEVVKRSK
jgi:beta-lactamase class A